MSTDPIIYHITTRSDWRTALTAGSYAAASLAAAGFIHCSTALQVVATANRLFKGRADLLLLCIDTAKVQAEIRKGWGDLVTIQLFSAPKRMGLEEAYTVLAGWMELADKGVEVETR